MITGVAFCPHPPALIPAVAQGAEAELEDLLTQCDRAITDIASTQPDRLVLLGAGPQSRAYPPSAWGSLAGFGVRVIVDAIGSCWLAVGVVTCVTAPTGL